jgi:lipopolysaccharide/colanic/teichoic acid biosynthesis glycosyltransferase
MKAKDQGQQGEEVADSPISFLLKRSLDFGVALMLLICLSPLILAVSLVVWLSMGRPILFRQSRPGRDGKKFMLVKFRTMTHAPEELQPLIADRERITFVGKLLRTASLDEIPTLWNVLTGEMSLVGPRPLLNRYYPYYTDRERTRFSVRPGITGWAQVNGRCNVPWNQRLEMDIWYVENWSIFLDIKILWMTIVRVIRRDNVSWVPSESLKYDLDVERSLKKET